MSRIGLEPPSIRRQRINHAHQKRRFTQAAKMCIRISSQRPATVLGKDRRYSFAREARRGFLVAGARGAVRDS